MQNLKKLKKIDGKKKMTIENKILMCEKLTTFDGELCSIFTNVPVVAYKLEDGKIKFNFITVDATTKKVFKQKNKAIRENNFIFLKDEINKLVAFVGEDLKWF